MRRRAARGFTLLEVLVALAVFAVVTLLAWRGLDLMTGAKARLDAEMRAWRELELVFERLNMDLTQLAPRVWTDADGRRRGPVQGSSNEAGTRCQLDLVRFGNDNEPLHTRYLIADGRLTLEFPPLPYTAAASVPVEARPAPYALLDHVSRCEFVFIDEKNAPQARWPTGANLADMARPHGLRLRLTLEGRGEFERVYYIP
ncbi:MAG: type II secretion system protein GspJ [Candidatus Dactylopiibacterium sp.]|nr:type II secretion system protein GspJ [Candidatus Dactylopiibacterium sp.]